MNYEEQAKFTKVAISEAISRTLYHVIENCTRVEAPLTEEQRIEMIATSLRGYHTIASEVEEIIDEEAIRAEMKAMMERIERPEVSLEVEWPTEEESKQYLEQLYSLFPDGLRPTEEDEDNWFEDA